MDNCKCAIPTDITEQVEIISRELVEWAEAYAETLNTTSLMLAEVFSPQLSAIGRELRSLAATPEFQPYFAELRADNHRRKRDARINLRASWRKQGHR